MRIGEVVTFSLGRLGRRSARVLEYYTFQREASEVCAYVVVEYEVAERARGVAHLRVEWLAPAAA